MHELITEQNQIDAAGQASAEREPSLRDLQQDNLPPLHELITEYRAMVQERQRQEHEQKIQFATTLSRWAERIGKGASCR